MANDTPSIGDVGGLIPFVWFDIIGRVVPGAYLILGSFEILWRRPSTGWLKENLRLPPVGPAVGFLLFVGAAYFVGFLLGNLSYWLIEWPFAEKIGERIWKPTLPGNGVRQIINDYYGTNWEGSPDSKRGKNFCSYYVWHKDPSLGAILSRWDAEALAGRSVAVVTAFLLALYLHYFGWSHCLFDLAFLLVIFFSSGYVLALSRSRE